MSDDTVICLSCGDEVSSLATFPGGICLECYKETPEATAPLTASMVRRMWGGRS